ncbi:hypothetical protein IWW45_002322 [Coemansia sp. RSA 485]|nr:hypothetical protein IWW45_002322 [Coemansia sp. RSA 485]
MSRSPTGRKRRRSSAVRRRRSVSAESSGREQRRRRADDDDSHGHSTDSRRSDRRRSAARSTRHRSRTESSVAPSKAPVSDPPSDCRVQEPGRAQRPTHRRHASSSAKLPAPTQQPRDRKDQKDRRSHSDHSDCDAPEPARSRRARDATEQPRDRRPRKDSHVPAKTPVSAAAAASTTPVAATAKHSDKRTKAPARVSDAARASKPSSDSVENPVAGSVPDTAPPTSVPVQTPAAPAADFGLSGKLAAETNTVNGVVLKYTEPPEARRPRHRWRIYVFKDAKDIDMHHIDSASAYLFGRDRKASYLQDIFDSLETALMLSKSRGETTVADIPIDHPSCSSQHAVLQYRQSDPNTIRPYIIDLNSTNGTFLNGDKMPVQRYVELRSEDVLRFGFSTREYVVLREK